MDPSQAFARGYFLCGVCREYKSPATTEAVKLDDGSACRECYDDEAFASGYFPCGVCLGYRNPATTKAANLDESNACRECYDDEIRPQSFAALKREYDFPVRWDYDILDPRRLPGFSAIVRIFWTDNIREYQAPPSKRFYCPHYYISGITPRIAAPPNLDQTAGPLKQCRAFIGAKNSETSRLACVHCHGITRSTCGMALWGSDHKCSSNSASDTNPLEV